MINLNLVLIAIFSSMITVLPQSSYPQSEQQGEANPEGNVVNSKYLSITENRYRNGEFSDIITGAIVNNSTQEISYVSVYAALYDRDNKLITMTSGSVDVPSLPAGDNSAFSITVDSAVGVVDHYMLFPGGTP